MKNLDIVLLSFFLIFFSCIRTAGPSSENESLEVLWMYETKLIDSPKAAPVIINNSSIIYTGERELVSLSLNNAEVIWRGEIDGERPLDSKKLLFYNNKVFSSHWNRILVWNLENGEKILDIGPSEGIVSFGFGRNTVVNNGIAVIGDTLDVYTINENGNVRFTLDLDYSTLSIGYYSEKIFLGQVKTINGGLTLGKVRAFSSITGDSLWSYSNKNGGFDWAAPIVEEGVVYAGAIGNSPIQEFVALNAETGELIWRQTNKVWTFNFIVGPNLVYVNTGGTLVALNKQTGAIEWRFEWESSAALITPVYLEGYIYHSDHGRIFILDADNGELVHEEPLPKGGGFFWHLAVSEDKLFAQTSYQLIAYQPWHLR